MKTKILTIISIAALFLTSCQKEEIAPLPTQAPKLEKIKVVVEVESNDALPEMEKYINLDFTAPQYNIEIKEMHRMASFYRITYTANVPSDKIFTCTVTPVYSGQDYKSINTVVITDVNNEILNYWKSNYQYNFDNTSPELKIQF
jgi:hypothetical protein